MLNVNEIKKSILDIIQNDSYSFHDLGNLLLPITKYNKYPLFMANLRQVVYVIIEDRNNDNKFDVNDLEILKNDRKSISSIVVGLLLVLGAIPNLKLKYKDGETEELLFKLLAYIFVIVIPKETGNEWTHNEKTQVVNIVVTIYKNIVYDNITKDSVDQVSVWFKYNKKGCSCINVDDYNEYKQGIAEKYLPKIGTNIQKDIEHNRKNNRLYEELQYLKAMKKRKSVKNGVKNGVKVMI